jgi:short subunit dehydrogenase-like uncharacterized protein
MDREFDFVVYGASGFTGWRVVERLATRHARRNEAAPIRFAIAGRTRSKLDKLHKFIAGALGQNAANRIEIIVASADDEKAMIAMASRARAVLNCAGPFRFSGEHVIRACLAAHTHYLDVTGEPEFVERMMVKYDDEAREKKLCIVHCCGLDSVPCDVGAQYIVQQFQERHPQGVVANIEAFLTITTENNATIKGNYGTYASLIHSFGGVQRLRETRRQLRKQQTLDGKIPQPKQVGPRTKPRTGMFFDERVKRRCTKFMGADSAVIRNTQFLNVRDQHRTGDDDAPNQNYAPQVSVYVTLSSWFAAIATAVMLYSLQLLSKFTWGKSLLLRFPQVFSFGRFSKSGVPDQDRMHTLLTIDIFANGYHDFAKAEKTFQDTSKWPEPETKLHLEVFGRDPAYSMTAHLLIECGMLLLNSQAQVTKRAGVITPGHAFGPQCQDLVENLSDVRWTISQK